MLRALTPWLIAPLLCAAPAEGQVAAPQAPPATPPTGGSQFGEPAPPVPGIRAVLREDGSAAAPDAAPPPVQAAILAANALQDKPYRWGGGHARVHASSCDRGCDCSGAVSFALGAAGLLRRPRDSSGLMRYGRRGPGRWITIYANRAHAYMVIADLRLDTSAVGDTAARGRGPRWRAGERPARGFRVRHPRGL